ncbi:MAG: tetratricopeptide repeat protein [Kiritimatiellia bacterium]
MNETPTGGHAEKIKPGAILGKHGIRQFMCTDPVLGDRYAVVFGTTNRIYDINVASGEPGTATLQDYGALVKTTATLRHPCLFSYFACGENDGIAWIRSEHSDGAPDWVTESVPPPPEKPSEETDEDAPDVYFPTLGSLLEFLASTGNRLAAKDRNLIIGDLTEALSHLHAHGCVAEEISADTVFLDRPYRDSSLVARLRYYAFPETHATGTIARNLRQLGELIETLLAASDSTRNARLDNALAAIASELVAGRTYADGGALHEAVCDAFKNAREPRKDRLDKQQPPPPGETKTAAAPTRPADAVRRRRSTRHRSKKRDYRAFNSTSSMGQIVGMALRIGLMFAGIVGVGVGVFFGMKHLENQSRSQARITSAERYSAITIIEDKSAEAALQGFPERIDDYSIEQLQTASEHGDPLATARLAIMTLLQDVRDPAARVHASQILDPQIEALKRLAQTDPAAAYWHGYVQLLGLDGPPDAPAAIASLERAIAQGHADAGILLGDWHAACGTGPKPENDRRALNCWRAAFGAPAQWTTTQFDAIERIIRFVREGRGFKNDDAALAKLLQNAAASGHAESVLLISELHEQGVLVEKNESSALSWLRQLASNDAVDPTLRAEVQRRMADKFAAGRGTPASAGAARIWYERSAKLGNVKAMLSLAALCDSGEGAQDGKPAPLEARYWRDKAATTVTPEPPKPTTRFSPEMLPSSAAGGEDKGTP